MTREEAIEILKAHHMWTGEPQEIIDVRKENKALEMAIQALSQEPCDECRNKHTSFCGNCKEYDEFEQEPMREFTEEEAKAYSRALDKMYKPTGFNVFDEPCDEIDFVQPHKKIPVTLDLTPCDDAVSREAAIEAVKQAIYNHDSAIMRLTELPPVTVRQTQMVDKSNFDVNQYKVDIDTAYECGKASERQTGKWIYRREDKYSCSKCGTTTSVDEAGIDEKPMYKFCPFCGARMESDANE